MNFTTVECIDKRIQIENDYGRMSSALREKNFDKENTHFQAASDSIPHPDMNVYIHNWTSLVAMIAKNTRGREQ
jgi:hypothetical protein